MTMPRIPTRSTGPTKARRPVGDLQGPPPGVRRQIRRITVVVEQLEDARWRFSMPHAPGWGFAARTPGEVTAGIRQAFTEAQVAAHSQWRAHVYDAAEASYRRSRPTARSRKRCDVYSPEMWALTDDGKWMSPRGLKYPEERQVVQRVMAARVAMGLSARPDPVNPDSSDDARRTA